MEGAVLFFVQPIKIIKVRPVLGFSHGGKRENISI
jgi:hypothetical protein